MPVKNAAKACAFAHTPNLFSERQSDSRFNKSALQQLSGLAVKQQNISAFDVCDTAGCQLGIISSLSFASLINPRGSDIVL
jgi:hypothetical protein